MHLFFVTERSKRWFDSWKCSRMVVIFMDFGQSQKILIQGTCDWLTKYINIRAVPQTWKYSLSFILMDNHYKTSVRIFWSLKNDPNFLIFRQAVLQIQLGEKMTAEGNYISGLSLLPWSAARTCMITKPFQFSPNRHTWQCWHFCIA